MATTQSWTQSHSGSQEQAVSTSYSNERTPLLSRNGSDYIDEAVDQEEAQDDAPSSTSLQDGNTYKTRLFQRWPSILALVVLCIVVVIILIVAFLSPQVLREYAAQAAVLEPTELSIATFTATGVVARIQGDFKLDPSRVKSGPVRNFGRFATWIAREANTDNAEVEVVLPEYGNLPLGYAAIPPIKVSLASGHTTHLDFLANLKPGSKEAMQRIAKDWMEGRLEHLTMQGRTDVSLKSGILSFGPHHIVQSLTFKQTDIPTIPDIDISELQIEQIRLPNRRTGLSATASITVSNPLPLSFEIPALGFGILSKNCMSDDPYINLADVTTQKVDVKAKEDIEVSVAGFIGDLPSSFLQACPGSDQSPLDALLGGYIHGLPTTLYIRGSARPSPDTPQWLSDLLSSITVPVSIPGRKLGHLIDSFALADVKFNLPELVGNPGESEPNLKISATAKANVSLPQEIKFPIELHRMRADADVYYKGDKLGRLDLHKWHNAISTPLNNTISNTTMLSIESQIKDAPLQVTDDEVFQKVIGDLFFGGNSLVLKVKAIVDVEVQMAIGTFVVRGVPAAGDVPVKPITGHNRTFFSPKVYDLKIAATEVNRIALTATVNITNPTTYAAYVPFVDIRVGVNGTDIGHANTAGVLVKPGNNTGIPISIYWDPSAYGGVNGTAIGSEFLSQYISGYNTSVTLRFHDGSFPSDHSLGHALRYLNITIPTPSLKPPRHGDDDGGHNGDGDGDARRFISDATMHLLTSSATFILHSPFKYSTLFVTSINATAFYKANAVGNIVYEEEIEVPPGASQTPLLPVDWSLASVGYEAVKKALGGSLKLNAEATVGVRIDKFRETVWYKGKGIGAKVRI